MARPIGATSLDTAFTDLTRSADDRVAVTVRDPGAGTGVRLWMDASHRWTQVFTGDGLPVHAREALAVEPMTAPPDAFNSGEDVVVLDVAGSAGAEHSVSWGIDAL
jgi:aldose 1-epimerase